MRIHGFSKFLEREFTPRDLPCPPNHSPPNHHAPTRDLTVNHPLTLIVTRIVTPPRSHTSPAESSSTLRKPRPILPTVHLPFPTNSTHPEFLILPSPHIALHQIRLHCPLEFRIRLPVVPDFPSLCPAILALSVNYLHSSLRLPVA